MPVYEVLPVRKPFGGREPGTMVELTEGEAAGFLDKLRAVDGDSPQPLATEEPAAEPKPKGKRTASKTE